MASLEVAPGIHRIEAHLDDRINCLYLLGGSRHTLLVDTGVDDTPGAYLVPYLEQIGYRPSGIDLVLTTHADVDHMGGNRSQRALSPDALFVCHELDRPMIECVERMIRERYREFDGEHGLDADPAAIAWFARQARAERMDLSLQGGERLRLADDWTVEILHTPGHSAGSLTVYDPRSRALIVGDAVLGDAVLTAQGAPAFPPTYRYVDRYLETIDRLQAIRADLLLTSHYPVFQGGAVAEFLTRSRAFVQQLDEAVRAEFERADEPLTLRALVARLGTAVGSWPPSAGVHLVYALAGHVEQLQRQVRLLLARSAPPVAWRWAD
ncbi:MAG: MBL fold metallo-hydrolase [Chloroflexi bacterium]|nr:MBL fold metallo-hydrolase [Chloroflexota bacterium]